MFRKIIEFFKRLFGIRDKIETVPYDPVDNFQEWSIRSQNLFTLVNDYRVSIGKTPFLPEKAGWIECYDRLDFQKEYYDKNGKISHDMMGLSDTDLRRLGFVNIYEILGFGWFLTKSCVEHWIASLKHNKIISGDYKYFSTGYYEDENQKRFYVGIVYN